MVLRRDFLTWCNETLQTALFKDYAPNGLQVEAEGIYRENRYVGNGKQGSD